MLKDGGTTNISGSWSRVCDTCQSAACTVYCRADSAYLCSGCDARIHAANGVASRHKRVWVCEACERAPAAFLCKADAASLCTSCDADIHSANPLASRHHRVPILPISGPLFSEREREFIDEEGIVDEGDDEAEAASWLLQNPVRNDDEEEGFLFWDEYLEPVDCNSCQHNNINNNYDNYVSYDRLCDVRFEDQPQQVQNYTTVPHHSYAVVPVQCGGEVLGHVQLQSQHFQPGLDFDSSKAGFSYDGSLSQSVSLSSLDVGVVPDSTISDISIMSHSKSTMGTSDLFPPLPMPSHLTPEDREARVLRYREKKKIRKFEKKIRYASRKAYAETRPRIKGRFAKRRS